MKRIFLSICFIAITLQGFSQTTFSVSPNTGFNIPGISSSNALFGYKVQNFNPYIGISMMRGDLHQEIEDNFDNYELDATIQVLSPTIGLKYFLPIKDELKAYLNISAFVPIVSGSIDDENSNSNEEILEDTKFIFFGTKFGFGTEYFLSKSFSLGGEFGFNHYRFTYKNKNDISTEKINVSATPTYTRISLNYYFGQNSSLDN